MKQEVERLLNFGKDDFLFSSYFGVNYDDDNLVSVKLYFSFLKELPHDDVLNEYIKDHNFIKLLKEHWTSSNKITHHHQGLTLSLKCYLEGNNVTINKYSYFRAQNFLLGFPEKINLNDEDKDNMPGFCIEHHQNKSELKKYYYISSSENIKKLIQLFSVDGISINDISFIEYTESKNDTKVNIALNSSNSVKSYLGSSNNLKIIELSEFFYTKFKLYYFSPGIRINNAVKALYYLPEYRYHELRSVNTLDLLFKN